MSQSSQQVDLLGSFRPIRAERSSERVAAVLRRTIIDGKLRPGDRLPPERDLAKRFAVTRNTVREAVRRLEQSRLVSIRQGSGVTVQDYLTTTGLEFVGELLGSSSGCSASLVQDVMQARAVLGAAIYFHVIDTVPLPALGPFDRAVDAFVAEAAEAEPDSRRLQRLEFDVHDALIRAAGNQAFVLLYNSLRRIYERVAHLFEGVVGDPTALADHYGRAAAALSQGDRDEAKVAFRAVFALTTPPPPAPVASTGRRRAEED
ncbi:MAG: FadR family transcriptional regulator [Deltaproteobacteria bacterium]|nr:FadR family transcriptional regulator [Deltaproteobacteria bacterium]